MQKKYKLVIFLLFTLSILFSQEEKRNIAFVINKEEILTSKALLCITYLVDIAEAKLLENYNDITLKNITGEVEFLNLKKVINYAFSNGINGFYYINITEQDNSIDIDISLYDSVGSMLHEQKLILLDVSNSDKYISNEKEEEWLNIIQNSIENVLALKEKRFMSKKYIKRNIKYKHDFPFFSLGLNAISSKLYFDNRMVIKAQKIFSFFPLDIRLTFFPLKYLEIGLFCKFDLNNMVFNYFNYNTDKYDYYDSNFVFCYGFFTGLSFFGDNNHYSLGIQIYNLFYSLTEDTEWRKTNDINSYFLPQFAIYQRLDLKIFKSLYFSVFFNFKTLPLFKLDGNYFNSTPFRYDFFCIELSFIGITLII